MRLQVAEDEATAVQEHHERTASAGPAVRLVDPGADAAGPGTSTRTSSAERTSPRLATGALRAGDRGAGVRGVIVCTGGKPR